MISNYRSEVLKIYEKIREEEERLLNLRREEIEKVVPEASDIERQIGKLSVQLSISILKNSDNAEQILKSMKEQITDLRVKKCELLVQKGYPSDYLEMHYQCAKCKDTGFIGTEQCTCYKPKLVQLYYKNSDLKNILQLSNFENFNFSYYSSNKINNVDPDSPKKNIEKIISKVWNYIEDFDKSDENLLFYGSSGTGKTFLSHCIAKELLDRGYLVVYRTAEDLIYNLREIRFNNNEGLEDLLMNCDLLIIDDLGTEQISEFSRMELFNLLNKKLLKKSKMLVSTNFSLEELLKTYSERISSRLFGEFTLNKFYGEDIRIKKKYN